jgi:hypothetical protein
MNGFVQNGLDEDAFGEKPSGGLRSFDAFRESVLSVKTPSSGQSLDARAS